MCQTLERKARFIGQVMRGKLDAREIGDIGDTALSFSEVKALATGNPLLMDKAEADVALARLQRAERAHHRNQDALRHAVARHEQNITGLDRQAADIDAAIARRQDTRGDRFAMTVGDRAHSKRAEAGQHLKKMLQEEVTALAGQRERSLRAGQLGGFPLIAEVRPSLGKTSVSITLDGAPGVNISMPARDLGKADPGTLVTRLEHRLHHLEDRKATVLADAGHANREIDHARESIGKAFPQAAELAQARQRARGIDEQLAQMAAPPQADTQPGAEPAPAEPETPQWFERTRGLESREALRQPPAPQPEPQDTASPAKAPEAGYDGRSWQPRDQEARRPGDVQPDAEASSAEPAGPRQWWERTRGLEPGGREIPETRQADAQAGQAPAGPESKQWFERARDGLDPARGEAQPDRDAAPSADPGGGHAWHPGTAPQMRYEPERDWEAGSLSPRLAAVPGCRWPRCG